MAPDMKRTGEIRYVNVAGDDIIPELFQSPLIVFTSTVGLDGYGILCVFASTWKGSFLKASPDFFFHLCQESLGWHCLPIGSKPYGMALPMFDDEEIVKDPIHIGQGKGRGVAGLHPIACQSVVIA